MVLKITKSSVIFVSISSLIAFYIGDRMAALYFSITDALNTVEKIFQTLDGILLNIKEKPFLIDISPNSIMVGVLFAAIVLLAWLYIKATEKHFRNGEEHGSARWGTPKDSAPFKAKKADDNVILSATESISLPELSFKYERNKNVLIIGGSGCGKSYGIIEPNLLQMHSSFVITDPKGTILPEMGHALEKNGYTIKVLNTINFRKSMHYNPLAYIKNEADILKVVDVIMKNTSGEGENKGEDFWIKSERMLYTALIAYLWYEAPMIDRNLPMLSDMIDMCGARENDEKYKSPMDILFEELEAREGRHHFAVKQYKKFKQAAGKTLKSILISCAARLAPFDIAEIRELMMEDELELNMIGDRKTAFFVIMSDTDTTFSFIVAMCFYQMFNVLCTHADDDCGGKLPIPVRCLFDEFANCGRIPMFEILISTIRSRLISAVIILQSKAQLKNTYKDHAETIIDCCDSYVFLGGKSTSTVEELSKMIGDETIDTVSFNTTKSQQGSFTTNNQKLKRNLLSPDEIMKIDRLDCIVSISGAPPFRSKKYDLAKHPRFKETGIANKKNMYDVEKKVGEFRNNFISTGISKTDAVVSIDVSELLDFQKESA